MTSIYLINNSLTIKNVNYDTNDDLKVRREKRILSVEGEEESKKLVSNRTLSGVNRIYSSNYVMSIATAKYLASYNDLTINVCDLLGERKIGNLGDKTIRMVNEMQEKDFDYKLRNGESFNDVKKRMLKFLKIILQDDEDRKIAVFTHNVAITALLSKWCNKGFNLDNRLILNYKDASIIDGTWLGINIIELVFDKEELVSIKRKK